MSDMDCPVRHSGSAGGSVVSSILVLGLKPNELSPDMGGDRLGGDSTGCLVWGLTELGANTGIFCTDDSGCDTELG